MAGKLIIPLLWKCFIAFTIIYIIDYLGICVHFFELDYERHFQLSKIYDQNATPAISNNYYQYALLKRAINKCSSTRGAASPHLTVLVKSALNNEQRRTVIRRTWGFEKRFSDVHYRCVFLVGITDDEKTMTSINQEATTNNDIVQGEFIDSYFNNTYKTMLGIRWAKEYCSGSDYYMFVDDDYYVSIKNILKFIAYPELYPNTMTGLWSHRQHNVKLASLTPMSSNEQRLFAGNVMQTSPLRHKFSKWYISLAEYPYDSWPPYVTAGAFLLSNDALAELYTAGKRTPAFRFDDIYMAMVALNADITLTDCDQFHFKPLIYKGTESYRHVLATHGYDDIVYMEKVWTECRAANYA